MSRPFTSIRHPIGIDLAIGRLTEEPSYAEHVDQLVRQVLLTDPGERVNRPDFGCGLRRMVFSGIGDATADVVKATVVRALDRWLHSAITVENVEVSVVASTLSVKVVYALRVTRQRRWLNVEVEA